MYKRQPQCRALRAALAARYGLAPEQVLCGNGAADLIFRIAACLKPRRALAPAPTFSEYERAVRAFGGTMEARPLSEENEFIPVSYTHLAAGRLHQPGQA